MQNKGAVKVLAILLALVCLYQLSFTLFSYNVERKARHYAERMAARQTDALVYEREFKKAEKHYLDSIARDTIYNFFWIRQYTHADCKERELNLGLDLKGGMNVMLEVSVYDVVKSLSNGSTDAAFLEALEKARTLPPSENFVDRFGRVYKEIAPEGKLAAIFSTIELREKVPFNASNEEVLAVLRAEAEGAIENSYTIIRNRIDRFGVTQPNVQRLERSGRILVELPGVKEPERVRKLLQGTASLEFWETYENSEVYGMLHQLNERLRLLQAGDTLGDSLSMKEPVVEPQAVAEEEGAGEVEESVLAQASDSLARQDSLVDRRKTQEEWAKENPLFALLTPSVTPNGELYPGPVVGIAHYKDTAAINAMLTDSRVRDLLMRDLRLLWTVKPAQWDKTESVYQLVAIRVTTRDGRPKLDGGAIAGARSEFSQTNRGESEVSMWMTAEGAKTWARMTSENLQRSIAIVLDDYVYSFPTVQSEIKGGRSSITGGFSIKEAKDLVNVLQSGKLPAPARIIQEEVVGPSLGQKAIDSGITSFLISFVIILLFMLVYYGGIAGLVADFALVTNLFFIVGVLASFQATLTLPGIAGIVLTLGMAVDANVLIFERIKEELASGKGLRASVNDGFRNALSAIIDGNVTTLLTGVILYAFGSGPIKGFATTLVIGILTSMFTAIFITRLVIGWILERRDKLSFSTRLTQGIFRNAKYRFIENRKYAYITSGILILAIIVSLFARGFDAGIDFVGGRTYEVRFNNQVLTDQVAELLEAPLGQRPQVKTFGESNQVKITTKYKINSDDPSVDAEVDSLVYNGLKPMLPSDINYDTFLTDYKLSSTKVGPTIALDIRREAVVAVVLALVAIFLYILLRFKNWRFSAGAVIGLAHNSVLIIGLYTLLWGIVPFTLEIDQAFVAAILTIIGYSINDTVVIFDRIREYIGLYPKHSSLQTINGAINGTLSRTFATSFSTLAVLIPMVFFGGESIRGFVFSLTIGIVVGTYCSIFIAAPLVYDFGKKSPQKR